MNAVVLALDGLVPRIIHHDAHTREALDVSRRVIYQGLPTNEVLVISKDDIGKIPFPFLWNESVSDKPFGLLVQAPYYSTTDINNTPAIFLEPLDVLKGALYRLYSLIERRGTKVVVDFLST